jgi:hypothetical protein
MIKSWEIFAIASILVYIFCAWINFAILWSITTTFRQIFRTCFNTFRLGIISLTCNNCYRTSSLSITLIILFIFPLRTWTLRLIDFLLTCFFFRNTYILIWVLFTSFHWWWYVCNQGWVVTFVHWIFFGCISDRDFVLILSENLEFTRGRCEIFGIVVLGWLKGYKHVWIWFQEELLGKFSVLINTTWWLNSSGAGINVI